jgi:hypothetical protein
MRGVDGHSDLVHALDNTHAEIADTFVVALRAPVPDQVATVVSEKRNTLAELVETIDIVGYPKML